MTDFSDKVKTHVPGHYLTEYPKFVLFLQKYYEWKYRQGGFTDEEKKILLTKKDWLQVNIDRFIESGDITDIASNEEEVSEAIRLLSEKKNPGTESVDLFKDFTLERDFSSFVSSDGDYFVTADDHHFETPNVAEKYVRMWIESQGFFLPEGERMDETLLVRMIKHINAIKGTQKAAELFFSLFFGEDISLNNGGNGGFYKPKYNIFTIDDKASLIDDIGSVIRDDDYYNEFSYVIKVKNPPEYYKLVFEAVYLKFLHPAGFKVFLEQADPNKIIRKRHEFLRASQATYIDSLGIMNLVGFNVARYENNKLILEQAATNLARRSIEVDSSDGWTLGANTTRIGKTVSPFGSVNATEYAPVANGDISVSQMVAVERNKDYCFSFYLKLETGTDPNGLLFHEWKRYAVYFNSGNFDNHLIEVKCNAVVGMQVSFACAQLEKDKMTSYIPTYNTSASRAADIVVNSVG